jgi:hypothetical protein
VLAFAPVKRPVTVETDYWHSIIPMCASSLASASTQIPSHLATRGGIEVDSFSPLRIYLSLEVSCRFLIASPSHIAGTSNGGAISDYHDTIGHMLAALSQPQVTLERGFGRFRTPHITQAAKGKVLRVECHFLIHRPLQVVSPNVLRHNAIILPLMPHQP